MAVKQGVLGSLGSVKIRLAAWVPARERYQRTYVPLTAETASQAGSDRIFSGEQGVRLWSIRSWAGGSGEEIWKPDAATYHRADGIKPVPVGEGLELERLVEASNDSGGSSDLADAQRLGLGLGGVWTMKANNGYKWDTANSRWAAGIATGAASSDATSLTDGDDTFMYSGHANGIIRRWKSGNNSAHYSTFTNAPVVRSFGGILFALDGDDLYEIDKTVTNTRVLRADVTGSSAVYRAATPWSYNRMSLSDKGPIWLQVLDNGQTLIWEYNVANDSQEILGKLTVDFAFPYSISYANGFVFVGFRYASAHAQTGHPYVYYQRGAQRGVAGPLHLETLAETASEPVLIAGMVGDDLIVFCADRVWAYNLTSGGISPIATTVTAGAFEDAITFGQEIFIAGASDKVDWARPDRYKASGTLNSGLHDLEYPGLRKRLLDVTALTDPLPANTSLAMSVVVDGGSPQALTGTHDVDGNRRYTWAAGVTDATAGYQFELVPTITTSDNTVSVKIRELIATAAAAAHRVEWVLSIDCSEMSAADIDALNGLVGQLVTFTDPFQNTEKETPDSFVVMVDTVVTPEVSAGHKSEDMVGRCRLISRDLVAGTGGS